MLLPKEKEAVLNSIVFDLQQVEGIIALVLGGSFVTGQATETSDLDVGAYYSEQKPFRIGVIKAIAEKYAINNTPTVTGFYEWGQWVNGGAWIETAAGKVDFLYKNIEQVKTTIEKAKNGEWQNDFEQQPPYGFSSIIYLAETYYCVPLFDPQSIIKNLKADVQTYPPKLKESVIQQSLWSAEFTIWHADSFSKKQDIFNTIGCLTRAVKNIVAALFALNEIYPLGDKRAIDILEKADNKPVNLRKRIEIVLCVNKETISDNIGLLKKLFGETVELTNGSYKAYYKLTN